MIGKTRILFLSVVACVVLLTCLALMPIKSFALDPGLYVADTGAETIYYINLQEPIGSNRHVFYQWGGTPYTGGPTMLEQDRNGNLLVTMRYAQSILRISPQGDVIETLPYHFDDQPYGIKYDASGNLYVSEYGGGKIHRISPSGEFLTVVEGQPGWYGIVDLEFDDRGNLYASVYSSQYPDNPPDTGRILRIRADLLSSFGPGSPPIVPAVITEGLNLPIGLTYRDGLLYVAESDPTKRIVTVVTVDPNTGYAETFYPPSGALDHAPADLAFDETGNLYVSQSYVVSKIDTTLNYSVLATGFSGFTRGMLYAALPPVPPEPEIIPKVLYVSNNPSNWIDNNEYIAKIDMASPAVTGTVTYFRATYNYYTNKDGWANPDGMTFVGNRLFITGFIPGTGNPNGIWEVDPNTGQEMFYFRTSTGRLLALATDGQYLYASHYYGNRYTIFKYTTAGKLVSSFRVPALMSGLAYGEGYLFGVYNNTVYKINATTGTVMAKFAMPWNNVMGLDFIGGGRPYLLASVYLRDKVYRIDLNSNLDYAGTWSEFGRIPAGYNNSVSAAPVADDGVVPPAPAAYPSDAARTNVY